ncbi:MAG: GGDEF domain-containing protein [Rhodocyclaceae bacterium]|nr:GGDEF domain-containing protein [Rhodocyclaceae bacterium]
MLNETLAKIWLRAWSMILTEMTAEEVVWLFWPVGHLSLLTTRRATIVMTRARLVAGLFAVLTPLWIVIDMMVFPPEVWHGLAWARLAASVAFGGILIATRRAEGMADAYKALGFLLAIPSAFYLYTYEHMALFDMHGLQGAIATGYTFLPFVMLAGLSIFPLTMVECVAFAFPMLLMPIVAVLLGGVAIDFPALAVTFWLLLLIVCVSALAGLSQLGFMIVFIREAIRDSMTGCFTRHSGEELLDLQFVLASRVHAPLALAFIDLDHFKLVNDSFGHDAGDQVLRNATLQLRKHLRAGDMLARWGGEEFVLIMPNTSATQACQGLQRVCEIGLGSAPDHKRVTASIGVAERQADETRDWSQLVELADARMYEAKKAGRNRIVGCEGIKNIAVAQ